jgi:Ca2+/Na+ antiporter
MMKNLYKAILYTTATALILIGLIMGIGSLIHDYHATMFAFIMSVVYACLALILYQFFEDQEKAAENEEVKTIKDKITKIKG